MNNNNLNIKKEILKKEKNNSNKILFLTLGLCFLILLAAIYSLFVGAAKIDFRDLIRVIFQGEKGMIYNIIWNIRLPAILTALTAGMGLALAGVVMQSILKNPLASPFTLGISHAAAFGAAFAIVVIDVSNLPFSSFLDGLYLPAITAFIFSQLAVIIVLTISASQRASRESIVLAASLGVNSRRLRLFAMTVSSVLTAVIISFVGVIGFIGLVTPHMIRKIAAGNQRQLFLNSTLAGGLLLIIADNLARTVFRPVVLPVGVLTAFLGAPLFIYLIVKGRQI